MSLSPGARLGHYEIIAPLGAGGMGEVYRARDTRLSRDVAIKVLPAELSSDAERLKRFEREAQAASSLSHPNIVTIYEIQRLDATPLIVMELVDGETLRDLLADGAFPIRKLLAIAAQVADGLARAHASGIVHRDLKPENVMVTRDGLVKILDFGLAKLAHPELDSGRAALQSTVSAGTTPGIVMGTVSYMSPEQASGHSVDFRSDQFSLGSVLYEMATGKQAFERATTAQTLAAIIQDEPEPIAAAAPRTPPPLRWIIEQCLAKEPRGRYASTEDLARDLSKLRDHLSELSTSAGIEIEEPRRRTRWGLLGAFAAGLMLLAGTYFLGRRVEHSQTSNPRFRQLTFRGAGIGTARFAPDGQTIVYSAQTEGRPPELFALRLDSPETRSLGLPPAHILSISSSGEMAILLLRPFALYSRIGHMAFEQILLRDPFLLCGTLAQASLSGGAPRELLEDVLFADWAPNGNDLCVVRRVGNKNRVEFPIGKAITEAEETFFNHPRISSPGARLAFKDWSGLFLTGRPNRDLSIADAAYEIAWSDATGEIWYSTLGPAGTQVRAVTPAGRERVVTTLPGDFVLYDISADGRVLLGRVIESAEILGSFPGEARERNLSHFDHSVAIDLSASGETLLFSDVSRLVSDVTRLNEESTYLRRTDGSPPKRLGRGTALSPDGRFVLEQERGVAVPRTRLLRTGPGEPKEVDTRGVRPEFIEVNRSGFFPDGRKIFFSGNEAGHGRRVWVQDIEGGKPRAVTPEEVRRPVLVGDGRFICARAVDFNWYLYPIETGEPQKVVGILPGEEPFHSTPDGKWLYIRGADELRPGETLMTTRVYRLDPWTGRRELCKEIPPINPRSGGAISTILFSADGKTCVYTHLRYSTELVLVEGLK